MEEKARELFDVAVQKLKDANEELCRPEEDVVAFMVCKNSQIAINNFLKGYLLQNGIEASSDEKIDELYAKCKSINENFGKINLEGFDCIADSLESRYCSSTEKVSRCFDIADGLDAFLREEKIIN